MLLYTSLPTSTVFVREEVLAGFSRLDKVNSPLLLETYVYSLKKDSYTAKTMRKLFSDINLLKEQNNVSLSGYDVSAFYQRYIVPNLKYLPSWYRANAPERFILGTCKLSWYTAISVGILHERLYQISDILMSYLTTTPCMLEANAYTGIKLIDLCDLYLAAYKEMLVYYAYGNLASHLYLMQDIDLTPRNATHYLTPTPLNTIGTLIATLPIKT